MDRQRMENCLAQLAAWRASGQSCAQWALANGVEPRELAGWCGHAKRWQAKLDGVASAPSLSKTPSGFVAASPPLPLLVPGSVRLEIAAGATRVELHWPVAHTRELATWLRELGL